MNIHQPIGIHKNLAQVNEELTSIMPLLHLERLIIKEEEEEGEEKEEEKGMTLQITAL